MPSFLQRGRRLGDLLKNGLAKSHDGIEVAACVRLGRTVSRDSTERYADRIVPQHAVLCYRDDGLGHIIHRMGRA